MFMTFPVLEANQAEWEGGCLYAGSHRVSSSQGFFLRNPQFDGNSCEYGFDDIWLWLTVCVYNNSVLLHF